MKFEKWIFLNYFAIFEEKQAESSQVNFRLKIQVFNACSFVFLHLSNSIFGFFKVTDLLTKLNYIQQHWFLIQMTFLIHLVSIELNFPLAGLLVNYLLKEKKSYF